MKYAFGLLILMMSCQSESVPLEERIIVEDEQTIIADQSATLLQVLGTVQDAGSPQINCQKDCCRDLFLQPDPSRMVVSLAVVDQRSEQKYLFEATPDLPQQLRDFSTSAGGGIAVDTLALVRSLSSSAQGENHSSDIPDGIFLTHAHIGHYTGLMYLGKEAMNADQVPVYAMPQMREFLRSNGPWSQLISNNNISLQALTDGERVELSPQLSVTPFLVPHRDEFSETVGYTISGPSKTALFIPDIDKWSKWETSIIDAISAVDYAFLDATFFDAAEINNRDISEIPHPFVVESLALFAELSAAERAKIHFIHFNHTNPLLRLESEATQQVLAAGLNIARVGQVFPL